MLVRQPRGYVVRVQQLARAGQLPAGFLARALQEFRRHNLVASHRGAIHGYSLAKPAHGITLREMAETTLAQVASRNPKHR